MLSGRNVLIGENAQGKTNLLEAIELIANGRSDRSSSDRELIMRGQSQALVEVSYSSEGISEVASLIFSAGERVSRKARLNGVAQPSSRKISRLTTVSFKAADLNLLRGGPKFRRDWLDELTTKLKGGHFELTHRYEKVLQQRNRLLKQLFEKGRVTASDMDQLKVWDEQIARLGAVLIKNRVHVFVALLPLAEGFQAELSGRKEVLNASYVFKQPEHSEQEEQEDREAGGDAVAAASAEGIAVSAQEQDNKAPRNRVDAGELREIGVGRLNEMSEMDLARLLLSQLRMRRREEIARKQTLSGPHRDDIAFFLNEFSATAYASQGQQRSLVLALKLAELKLVRERLEEAPLLLLDDVLAELDLGRQGMLMQLVDADMQTLITTTHLDGFRPEWLAGAQVIEIVNGEILSENAKFRSHSTS
jgi:DNA replication and repair protein RecF